MGEGGKDVIIRIDVKRHAYGQSESYMNSFEVEATENMSVIQLLHMINEQRPIRDLFGNEVPPIQYEQSCQQKQCGGCAMVINGVPKLACAAFVRDLCALQNRISLEPLSKFPVICDLKVDRSAMYEHAREMKLWVQEIKEEKVLAKYQDFLYESAACLMCGCCLEVCPNYSKDGKFYGASAMNMAGRVLRMEKDKDKRKEVKRGNKTHGSSHCSKSLGCEQVCPAHLPLSVHISNLYRF